MQRMVRMDQLGPVAIYVWHVAKKIVVAWHQNRRRCHESKPCTRYPGTDPRMVLNSSAVIGRRGISASARTPPSAYHRRPHLNFCFTWQRHCKLEASRAHSSHRTVFGRHFATMRNSPQSTRSAAVFRTSAIQIRVVCHDHPRSRGICL